jgi:phosphopantothenoylcysteine decarboxylase/phosphopantothenate--cysteine ligase
MSNKLTMKVILGVTGSISAYKAVELMRLFQKNGHGVSVVMTGAAQKFIPALTFETFTPGCVYTGMFDPHQDPVLHINLCRDSDLLLIAPASANIIGKMANGIADDLLSTVFLAFYRTVVVAPAMNCHMLENLAVQENISRLRARGVGVIDPDEGSLACAYEGKGRLPDPQRIYDYCLKRVTGAVDV